MYFNRLGQPISFEEWATLHQDINYRRIALTELEDGLSVSTVWLGIDHGYGGVRLIFETMAFRDTGGPYRESLDCTQSSTEAEALEDHSAMVAVFERNSVGSVDTDVRSRFKSGLVG